MKHLAILMILGLVLFSCRDDSRDRTDIDNWEKIETDKYTKELYPDDDTDWEVYREGDKIKIRETNQQGIKHIGEKAEFKLQGFISTDWSGGKYTSVKTDSGWIVASNEGEFGGGACWISDNQDNDYEFFNEPISDMFVVNDTIYAITGIFEHTGLSVSLKNDTSGRYEFKQLLPLPGQMKFMLREESGVIILAGGRLITKLSPDLESMNTIVNGFHNRHANSMIRANPYVHYIGMRGCVAKIYNLYTNPYVEYLVPPVENL